MPIMAAGAGRGPGEAMLGKQPWATECGEHLFTAVGAASSMGLPCEAHRGWGMPGGPAHHRCADTPLWPAHLLLLALPLPMESPPLCPQTLPLRGGPRLRKQVRIWRWTPAGWPRTLPTQTPVAGTSAQWDGVPRATVEQQGKEEAQTGCVRVVSILMSTAVVKKKPGLSAVPVWPQGQAEAVVVVGGGICLRACWAGPGSQPRGGGRPAGCQVAGMGLGKGLCLFGTVVRPRPLGSSAGQRQLPEARSPPPCPGGPSYCRK